MSPQKDSQLCSVTSAYSLEQVAQCATREVDVCARSGVNDCSCVGSVGCVCSVGRVGSVVLVSDGYTVGITSCY